MIGAICGAALALWTVNKVDKLMGGIMNRIKVYFAMREIKKWAKEIAERELKKGVSDEQ